MFDGKAFGAEIVGVVKDYMRREIEQIAAQLKELQDRAPVSGKDGAPGKDGRDGKDAAPVTRDMIIDAIRSDPTIIAEAVRLHIEANPPQAGKDGRDGRDGKDGAPGEPGKDGVGLAGMLIDRGGGLVATLSDGSMRALGFVVGNDGEPGAPGRDGSDGLGFDDMTAEYDGERGITLRFEREGQTKEFAFSFPVVLDRGVFKDGTTYEAGDAVTWGGSLWIAQKATSDKPEAGDGWRLAVKRGRDGKQGEPGKAGVPGEPGRPGKDLTQLGPDGRKW